MGTRSARAPPASHGVIATTVGTVTVIIHAGGPRAGDVADVADLPTDSFLVYDGPRWFGVYERSRPLRTVPTDLGDAEVWTVRQ
jgi:hypothetical protein